MLPGPPKCCNYCWLTWLSFLIHGLCHRLLGCRFRCRSGSCCIVGSSVVEQVQGTRIRSSALRSKLLVDLGLIEAHLSSPSLYSPLMCCSSCWGSRGNVLSQLANTQANVASCRLSRAQWRIEIQVSPILGVTCLWPWNMLKLSRPVQTNTCTIKTRIQSWIPNIFISHVINWDHRR